MNAHSLCPAHMQLYSSNDSKLIKPVKTSNKKQTNKQNVNKVDRTIISYNYQLATSKNDI